MRDLITFTFESQQVRSYVDGHGNPWWVAKDVCEVLGIADHKQAFERLEHDEGGRYSVPTPSGEFDWRLLTEEK